MTITCGNNEDIDVFDVVKGPPSGRHVVLPFSFARSFVKNRCSSDVNDSSQQPSVALKQINDSSSTSFTGTLRPHQQKVRDAAIKSLNNTGSIVISAEPGFGKTITSIEMICTINEPTIIFVKQALIMDQWVDAIARNAPDKKVAKITSTKPIDPEVDVYLMNPIILKKPINETRFMFNDFEHIKLLVVDELHQIVTKVLHKAFFKFQPDYVIGLSTSTTSRRMPMQKKETKNDNHLKSKYLYFCKEERDKNPKIMLTNIAIMWAANKDDDKLNERYQTAKEKAIAAPVSIEA